ncbi:MAG: CRISPR-associated helicase Cas3' [Magnetococcales bacterium]|nr:CRISPR-associated helicase Cas3' [Magnetococcales bacterium]
MGGFAATNLKEFNVAFRSPWGKKSGPVSHHLAHHCADVAVCFEGLVTQPVVRNRLEQVAGRALTALDIKRLAMLAFLHDVGKLHPGFQAKGWPDGTWRSAKTGHVAAGAAIFLSGAAEWTIAYNLHMKALELWGVNEHLLCAVLAHHGRPFQPNGVQNWQPVAGYDPVVAAREMGEVLLCWFAPAFAVGGASLPTNPDFQHLLCGLVTLADWLGSMQAIFDYQPELDLHYMEQARTKARRALVETGLEVGALQRIGTARTDFATLSGRMDPPRPAQRLVGAWSLDDKLLILEAETGSGKTEAALWRFAQLFVAGRVESLYFALPTRAAARQIHGRVQQAMRRLFGEQAPEVVLAVPGYLLAGEVAGRALAGWEVRWDDDDGRDERQHLARWAAESTKRYLAATVAVGTVDQVMLAGLQVKHAHLRGAALSRSLLVVDEVHASDSYMNTVQTHLLKMHVGRGGHAMLMSATLGSVARTRWLTQRRQAPVPAFQEAIAAPYPAVWGLGRSEPLGVEPTGREKRVIMTLASSWEAREAARRAMAAAQTGARVLVIRNTVKAAVGSFRAVRDAGGESLLWQVAGGAALHHSRFAGEDRALLDRSLEKTLAPHGVRMSGGVIVIGTQTLEQSLDIDADLLITDLCPVDVLLQRIGRLHRHDLPRPAGFETPACMVLAPQEGLDRLATPAFDNGLGCMRDGGGVYRNLHACELTRRLVLDHPEWVIPAMNRFLVESATHPHKIEALNVEKGAVWKNYWDDVVGREMNEAGAADRVRLATDREFADVRVRFPDNEEKIRTRLGAEGARIIFQEPVVGPFGQIINGVTLPAHWSRGVVPEEKVAARVENGLVFFHVGNDSFCYGREGLAKVGR